MNPELIHNVKPMKELSLHILDIAMNSISAGAMTVMISLAETAETLDIAITDDGCGMTEETLSHLFEPGFTTKPDGCGGFGAPLFKAVAERTGGYVKVSSKSELLHRNDHGTEMKARFYKKSAEFTPLGDIIETVVTLIQGSPEKDFVFRHENEETTVILDTRELRPVLGEKISLSSYEVLGWIRGYLEDQYVHN